MLCRIKKQAVDLVHRIFWGLFITALVLFLTSLGMVIAFRFLPPPASAIMLERQAVSRLHHKPIPFLYRWMPMDRISPWAPVAAVTSEDQLFAEHNGFDWEAIRKAYEWNQTHRKIHGASTISQQTAKNLFLWDGRSWIRKGLEAYFTLLIETLWPKARILEMYLNIVEFGDGIYGVEAASQHFFHKPASQLNNSEAALLIAVLPNPHIYHVDNPNRWVLESQKWILDNYHRVGGLDYLKKLD